ncbi:carnitine O-acetyltransferase yat1 [Umbelopsis nana]
MSRSSPHLSPDPTGGVTFSSQDKLPKLPIPDLKATTDKYLAALEALQTPKEHEATKVAVQHFLDNEGPALQEKLQTYATDKKSYIEEFWYDSYLQYTDSVVLNLNPFFLLEDDPTPQRSDQVVRAASLITSTLKFITALRHKTLEPDVFRGTPLCMSQFSRLFGTARMPTENGCYMQSEEEARHIVVLAHSQFYHFEVFDEDGNIAVTEKEIVANLKAIRSDAAKTPVHEIAKNSVGVLTTESRPNWARLRERLNEGGENREALKVVDTSLFIVCLDHVSPETSDDLSTNMLCGSYEIDRGVQVGTCTNRWYDKLQIIVCKNGSAGINFEHTGVDGHTVLRFVSDIYTDTILRFAQTINSQTKSIFHSVTQNGDHRRSSSVSSTSTNQLQDINPRKIEWKLNKELKLGIRFAETRLSDLILQNEVNVLEFDDYGKSFIVDMKLSPDAFVQMAFQAAYYDLYGKIECTYEPAMTKTFLHGRTEAIRTVTPEVADFVKMFSERNGDNRGVLDALRKAISKHSKLTRECSKGLGHDRHLYALSCLWERLHNDEKTPKIFTDAGWAIMNHTVISTSNCGNPALRLFGFGPTVGNGFGIGYIIKDDGIALCVSSKHRQTARYLATLKQYLLDIKQMLTNERYPTGTSQRQRLLAMQESANLTNGYGYWDIDNLSDQKPSEEVKANFRKVGRRLMLNDVTA